MKTINKISSNNEVNMKQEIMYQLPIIYTEKQKELEDKNTQKLILNENYNLKSNEYNKIQQLISQIEIKIEEKNEKSDSLKAQQKVIFISINPELFSDFKEKSHKINHEIYEAFLIFLDFENKNENQLDYLLKHKEDLITLLYDSFEYFKILNELNHDNYSNKKMNILTSINKLRNLIDYPFEILFNFIENSFKIIDYKYENNKEKKRLIGLIADKNKLLTELNIINDERKKNDIEIKKLDDYTKQISFIIKDYKSIFTATNTLEEKNVIKNRVKMFFDNLKQNELYKSKKQKMKNLSSPRYQKPVKTIPALTLQNIKEEINKVSKNTKINSNTQTINANYRIFNKRNNTYNNTLISSENSESEKIKKPIQTIAKLKSRSKMIKKEKDDIKGFTVNNFYKGKSKSKNNNNNYKKQCNKTINAQRNNNYNFHHKNINTVENNNFFYDNNEYNINNELEIQKLHSEENLIKISEEDKFDKIGRTTFNHKNKKLSIDEHLNNKNYNGW